MMPSLQTALVCACSFLLAIVATESLVLVAILKKRRVKASGWFHKFGFTIEASDPPNVARK